MSSRFRTLFRVLTIDNEGIWCVLPAWDSRLAVRFDYGVLPFSLTTATPGFRFHAVVDLSAITADQLQPSDFEPPPARIVWLCQGCQQYRWGGPTAPPACPCCESAHFEVENQS